MSSSSEYAKRFYEMANRSKDGCRNRTGTDNHLDITTGLWSFFSYLISNLTVGFPSSSSSLHRQTPVPDGENNVCWLFRASQS